MTIRVWTAAAAFATIMGFSRLAYGALVPAMHAALGGPYALYGTIGGANFAGYLAGTLLATRLAKTPRRAGYNFAALVTMSAAMAASGLAPGALELGVLRFIVGVASAVGLVLSLGLAVEDVPAGKRGVAAAIVWAGGALGIAIVGAVSLAVPLESSAWIWRAAWGAMGAAGLVCAFALLFVTSGARAVAPLVDDGGPLGLFDRRGYGPLTIAYGLFGLGYIGALTFFATSLNQSHALPVPMAWLILGSAGIVGARLWGPLVDRFRSGVPVAVASGICAAGSIASTLPGAAAAIFASLLIGISFLGIPAMVGALLQQREPPRRYPRAFAAITVVLGVGQIAGPVLGGVAADARGPAAAMLLAAGALLLAALFALRYRRTVRPDSATASAAVRDRRTLSMS